MTCSFRRSISHSILSAAYDHADEDHIGIFEREEGIISSLAEAGDSLTEYLAEVGDPAIAATLQLIDKRIQERRAAYQNFSEETPKPDFFEAERRRVAEIGLEDLYTIGDHANARK